MISSDLPRIVVVDDDASMRRALARLLRVENYLPITFPSAEALLENGVPAHTDCLVFDVCLPGLTGFELYRRLAAVERTPPVIFMTAYDESEYRAQCQSLAAAAFLLKPFAGDDLLNAIHNALQTMSRDIAPNLETGEQP